MERILASLVGLYILAGCPLQVASTSYTHYRLPASIEPDRYHLKIVTHLDAAAAFTFDGEVSIRFQVLEDTSNITLHVENLTVDDSRIQLHSYENKYFCLCREGIDTVPEQSYYIISLCQNLIKDQIYELKLYFSGILNDEFYGYHRTPYVDEGSNETRWLSVTQFEPVFARTAFPCLDEPIYKATFIIWLGHHKSKTALSNMPLEKQIPLDASKDFVWSIFKETVPMSTYLVAYSVNDFAHKESKGVGSDVIFRTWSRQDAIDQCDYAAQVGPNILKYYEELFGIPFPLKKVDQIAIPDMKQGGMENWGLITYEEPYLLFAPNVSSQLNKLQITKFMAHELAHQWFGNLVTMKWWTDVWLNEGFATYIASLGVQHISPEFEMYNGESLANSIAIFRTDVELNSRPISQPIFNSNDIMDRFDTISYSKGSVILRMTHMFMGKEGFFEAVRSYLTKYMYNNAEQDDLWAALTTAAHKFNRIKPQYDMKTIMDSWTLQSGYPLVKVSRNYETGSIEISQHRYLKTPNQSDDEATKCWWIPLSYTSTSKSDFTTTTPKAWLECDESGQRVPLKLHNVTGANEWIIFNIQLTGLYRVMYDTDNWRLIKDTLHSDQYLDIHVMNRAQIIGDALSFAWYGYHGYDTVFDVLEYLNKEREYLPWKSALDGLSDIINLLEHFPHHRSCFYTYMRYIIEPIYYYVDGLNDRMETSMTPFQVAHKSLMTEWACRVELDDCVVTAINYFQQWKLSKNPDEENAIPVDLRYSVYCTAIRHGDSDDWSFLSERYKISKVSAEKTAIIKSLACSPTKMMSGDFVGLMLYKDNNVLEDDIFIIIDLEINNELNSIIAREYYASLDDVDVPSLLDFLSGRIDSIATLNRIQKFDDESFNLKIQWTQNNLEAIKSQLQRRLWFMDILEDNVAD